MSSSTIFGGLTNVLGALQAQQYALDLTQKNIANASTPGYSRQRPEFTPGGDGNLAYGSAAPSVSVVSYRDKFIDYRVAQELPGQGEFDTVSQALQQVDGILNTQNGKDLQSALSGFFNSFSALANAPDDLALRQQVLAQAGQLAARFHDVYTSVQNVQMSQDRAVPGVVDEINNLTKQVADLNAKVAASQATNASDASIYRDQRQELLDKLSGLADVSYFETESGSFTVTTSQGDVLVLEDQNRNLMATTLPGFNMTQVVLDGKNVTSQFQSGKLGGLLKVRDQNLAGYLTTLDNLAAGLITRVNAQNAAGWNLNGIAGGDFFTPLTAGSAGAAHDISLAITDPRLIAAAALGAGPGSNANAQLLAGIRDDASFLPGGLAAHEFYAGLVSSVGSDYRAAADGSKTQEQILLQLKNQRDSLSGVNLDEEAVNLVKFQKAYEASARLSQVWNSLADAAMNILGA